MSDVAIRAEDLSKAYKLGRRRRHDTLRDLLAEAARAPFGGKKKGGDETLWALKGVSFEVGHGEVVGIIGSNGAGKSTLLKILSRITEPTSGQAVVRGRLGSLLEVGTGFDPELTGRENVFLNGAILGMKREEIRRRFDEIVEFSEIERFIDTPVKRYSSGMYMRLAFAVAAHLEPEILIVDEVLAVGDAAFQRKCLGKMGNVAETGRTVLFVSHNTLAVEDLCDRVMWLADGQVVEQGKPKPVISSYLKTTMSSDTQKVWREASDAPGDDAVRLLSASVGPQGGAPGDEITVRTPLEISFEYRVSKPGGRYSISVALYNEQGVVVFTSGTGAGPEDSPPGVYRSVCRVPGDLLNDGMHLLTVYVDRNGRTVVQGDEVLVFDVRDDVAARHGWHGKWVGAVRPMLDWHTDFEEQR